VRNRVGLPARGWTGFSRTRFSWTGVGARRTAGEWMRFSWTGVSARRAAGELTWVSLSVLGGLWAIWVFFTGHGADLHAYWTANLGDLYGRTTGIQAGDGFFYAPPIALLLAPLKILPWQVARLLWLAVQMAALRYVAGRWALAAVLLPPVWLDMFYGNIYILFAAMIVAGLRQPSRWLFGLLTKVTPGIGLVWFAVRREWVHLARAAALLAGIVVLSLLVQGVGPWVAWITTLQRLATLPIPADALQIPLLPRVAVAVGVVAFGARTDRRWTIPVAMTLAMPTLWPVALVPLLTIPLVTTRPAIGVAAVARSLRTWLRSRNQGEFGMGSSAGRVLAFDGDPLSRE